MSPFRLAALRPSLWLLLLSCAAGGCSNMNSLLMGIPAIPANRLPYEMRQGQFRDELVDISMTRLRQDPPDRYLIGPGDILGVYVETILGPLDEPPPVHFPEEGDDAPAIGYPIPVREDGTIALPEASEIYVEGKSLEEVNTLIRQEYTVNTQKLKPGNDRIIVTLMRKRQFRVLVVREEAGGVEDVTKHGAGFTIDLDAYENDLLHALNETGGMPGDDAKNEVVIYRGLFQSGVHHDELIAQIKGAKMPCTCSPPIPDDPNVVRIPLKYHPSNPPVFDQEDVILQDGDIVMIESRDREVYYTGGALRGGEYMLPRDRDLDVLAAISRAGGYIGPAGIGVGGLGSGYRNPTISAGKAPSRAIVLRQLCDGQQLAIRVDLNRALTDSSQRIIIHPGDTIIVQYTVCEEIYNAALGLLQFNFLFNGFRGGGL